MASNRYSLPCLSEAVRTSLSKRQVLNKLGIISEGGNYSTLSKYINKYSIDTSHFIGQAINKGKHWTHAPIEDYLNNKRSVSSSRLKKRLLSEGLIKLICYKCSLTHWMGQTISLELDHIDGNNKNNNLNNLRLLCPNCHAQTPTYRGRKLSKTIASAISAILALSSFTYAAKRPSSERINGEYWAIKWVSGTMDKYDPSEVGRTECSERTIYILKTDCAVEVDTIVHETLHAFTCICTMHSGCHPDNQKYNNPYDKDHPDDDHPGIYFLAPKLLLWIQENPELVRWLQSQTPVPYSSVLGK